MTDNKKLLAWIDDNEDWIDSCGWKISPELFKKALKNKEFEKEPCELCGRISCTIEKRTDTVGKTIISYFRDVPFNAKFCGNCGREL